jgi:flagellar hook protein FlgE
MSLNTFSTGLSGLNANGQGLNVIGNNLANLNTVGFKSSDISFSEVMGRLGSQVSGIRSTFSQGGVQTSNNPLDVAIQGRGFLVQSNGSNRFYTRAGNLHLDNDGYLVGGNNMNVQGYMRNSNTGLIDQNLGIGNIQVPTGLMAPVATTQFELGMNLDASAPTGTQFSATVQMYDTQGKSHMATMSLIKDITGGATPTTLWRYDLTIPENEVAGASATSTNRFSLLTGAVVSSATPDAGALQFDDNGVLTSAWIGADPATPPALANLTVPPTGVTLPALANGASLAGMTWNLANNTTTNGISGFSSPSEMSIVNQNGSAPGSMSSISVTPDGTLSAVFSNGRTLNVGQIVLAQFSNNEGLHAEGGGLFTETPESGVNRMGTPGDSSLGSLLGGALEQSNVDLASELTKIITFQRGYQANSRIITTTDQIMQETLNLIR